MIQWTSAGAVSNALGLQIRVSQGHPARMGVGAPRPSRDLESQELFANIRHFTVNRRGPRTAPCTGLVLAGGGLLARGDLHEAVALARDSGVIRVVVHGDWNEIVELQRSAIADSVVVSVLKPADVMVQNRSDVLGSSVTVVVALNHQVVAELHDVVAEVLERRPGKLVLTWPFTAESAPAVDDVVQALRGIEDRLAQQSMLWGLKNLPPCQLRGGDVPYDRSWRSGNRWYVDADHQTDQALLFFPDVVRFYKGDSCRYCSSDRDCDGVSLSRFREGLTKPLQPL